MEGHITIFRNITFNMASAPAHNPIQSTLKLLIGYKIPFLAAFWHSKVFATKIMQYLRWLCPCSPRHNGTGYKEGCCADRMMAVRIWLGFCWGDPWWWRHSLEIQQYCLLANLWRKKWYTCRDDWLDAWKGQMQRWYHTADKLIVLSSQYKRPYKNVVPTWVEKSASNSIWMTSYEMQNWYMNGSIISKFFQIGVKIGSNFRKIKRWAEWHMNDSLFLEKLIGKMGLLSNFMEAYPYQNQTWVGPTPGNFNPYCAYGVGMEFVLSVVPMIVTPQMFQKLKEKI